jgi:transcriptional repressor NrdR
VIDSRLSKDGHAIRRRRECDLCARRFTTYERVETILPMVIKKDGRREPFDRQKLKHGILTACQKRPISVNAIDQFVEELERKVLESGDREVTSQALGEEVMQFLQGADEVAYVRFASVYRSFKDLKEFMSELQDLVQQGRPRKGERR